MRMLFCIILAALLNFNCHASGIDRTTIRHSFSLCTDKEKTELLHQTLEKSKDESDIVNGYRGTLLAMQARFGFNPARKYRLCKEGLSMLNIAISKSPDDLELRYLRLVVESNIPSILGMNQNIDTDKKIILSGLAKERDIQLKVMIKSFMLNNNICTEKEFKSSFGSTDEALYVPSH